MSNDQQVPTALSLYVVCPACNGSGGRDEKRCMTCKGYGSVKRTHQGAQHGE